MKRIRNRLARQLASACGHDRSRLLLAALRAGNTAGKIAMPPLDPAQSFKLHSETTDAVRMEALADSYQEAKGRAVQYARTACALKQEARKLERQAEQLLEDAAGERKKTKRYYNQMYSGREAVVSHRRMASREFAEKSKRQE